MNELMLLFFISLLAISKIGQTKTINNDDDTARYCRICPDHTMCRFQYDEPGLNCREMSSVDLDDVEIEWLQLRHNSLRHTSGDDAKMIWDDELARIALRWAYQCNLHDTDSCHNVERFPVLQLVNAIELSDVLDDRTSFQRLAHHVSTWGETFIAHSKESTSSNSSIGPMTRFGCARATYRVEFESEKPWVETLVCNYGPVVPIKKQHERSQTNTTTTSSSAAVRINPMTTSTTTTTTRHRGFLFYLAGYLFLFSDVFVRNSFS